MKARSVSLILMFLAIVGSSTRAADEPLVLNLWPDGKVPGETAPIGEEKIEGNKGGRRVTNVSVPTISVYRPAAEKNTGIAVIVAPGGGYRMLAWDHEGEDIAAWLNSLGITGVVLKYRVPRRPDHPKHPLSDAQRAISIVRSKASEWNIKPEKIGMLGFSAGGHLTAATATNFDSRAYEPIDDSDKASCRPDFAVIIYPGGVIARGSENLAPEIKVTKQTPPTFLAQATDDQVNSENCVRLYLALKKAGVPAEMHLYASGGHGFGMRPSANPSSQWPKRCEEWMRERKILETPAKP